MSLDVRRTLRFLPSELHISTVYTICSCVKERAWFSGLTGKLKGAALLRRPATKGSDLERRVMRQYRQVRCTRLVEGQAGRLP